MSINNVCVDFKVKIVNGVNRYYINGVEITMVANCSINADPSRIEDGKCKTDLTKVEISFYTPKIMVEEV